MLLTFVALFFFAFGVCLLISAYQLKDPFAFILTFFASNLVILISAALGLGFVLRLRRSRYTKATNQRRPPQTL
jgi:hypothetical protein